MCGAEGYYQSFKNIIEERKERAIQFPYHLNIVGTNLIKFKNVTKPEQHTLDMRSEEEKKLVRQSKMTHTLKRQSDNWNDKPELVSQHITE